MNRLAAALGLLTFVSAPAAQAQSEGDAMRKAASDFYTVVQPQVSGIPDAAARARLRPTITPALDQLLSGAAAAEDKFMAANKNAPPLFDGDLFSSLFEGVTTFTVAACNATAATCSVALVYDDRRGKAVNWTDTLYLVQTSAGWRVDDIGYGGTWAFGNKGRLKDTLKWVTNAVSP